MKIYLAGKVQKGQDDEKADWRQAFIALAPRHEYLDPNTADYSSMPIESYFGRDVHMIHSSDIVIVDASIRLGIGTAQEILIAKYYSKPVIAICPFDTQHHKEIRVNGEKKRYLHPFLSATCDEVVDSYEQAAQLLDGYAQGNKYVKTIDVIEEERQEYVSTYLEEDAYVQQKTK